MSHITNTSIRWGSDPCITTHELTDLNYLLFQISCHSIWPISYLHTIPIERCAFLYALVTDAPMSFPTFFIWSLVEVHRSSSTSNGLFFPVFIHRFLLHLGLEDFLASEPVHIIAPIGATFLRKRATQMKASSKRPKVESSQVHLVLLPLVTPLPRSMSIPLLLLILHLLHRVMLLYRVCWTLSWSFKQHMDKFWSMCLRSFRLYVLIWQVLDDLLLLMMSLDCPLAIHPKNGEYTLCMEIGGVFFFFFFCFGVHRLYLGASLMYFFLFGSRCIYF